GALLVPADDSAETGENQAMCQQLVEYPHVSQDQWVDCISTFIIHNVASLVLNIQSLRAERREEQTAVRETLLSRLRAQMMEARKGRTKSPGRTAQEFALLAAG
ncbi:MAG: hypothetical protein ABIG68_13605, partial [Acidobacteriota bacterium]